jgi:hypothetical protein
MHLELDFVYETLRCLSIGGQWTNKKKGRTPSLFGGAQLLDFCFLTNKNVDYEKTKKGKV